jgi:CRP/FNR family transcriptional regulator, cyclic AMP receptor protein
MRLKASFVEILQGRRGAVINNPQSKREAGTNMSDQDRYDALRASRLAAELSDEQCRILAAEVELLDLSDKQVLVLEGVADDHLYAVVTGELSVVRHPRGEEPTTLHTLIAGDLAGELSFIDGSERYASLQARGPTRVLSLTRERLESLLDSHPHIVYRVMRAIIRIAHQIQRRLSAQSIELANYIYKQHGRY